MPTIDLIVDHGPPQNVLLAVSELKEVVLVAVEICRLDVHAVLDYVFAFEAVFVGLVAHELAELPSVEVADIAVLIVVDPHLTNFALHRRRLFEVPDPPGRVLLLPCWFEHDLNITTVMSHCEL